MTIGVANFSGERLREARLARGLYMKSLGDLIGVSGTAIGNYESGADKPQPERVKQLSEQLQFPAEFFSRRPWPDSIEPVFWRSRAAVTKHAREMTEQRMKWMCEIFAFLTAEVNVPAPNLPDLNLPGDFRLLTPENIEGAAGQLRRSWGLRDLPIPDMILALENVGIPVTTLEIASDKQDGFCFRCASLGRAFVGINTYNVSACRGRLDAAHELGHIVLHGRVTPEQERDPASRKMIEQQAFRFAGALLFPRHAFLSEVGALSLDYFSSLKKRWGMSIAAMISRAYDLGLIDNENRRVMFQNMTRRRWRGGPLREPFDDLSVMPLERPRMLRRALDVVLSEGIFGRAAIRAALPLPVNELEQLIGVSPGFLRDGADIIAISAALRRDKPEALDLETGRIVEFIPRKKN
jgi:Zn-dependent peptidase ImmA (M78 family)/transcriptional regulator with XRE-family HTH domain